MRDSHPVNLAFVPALSNACSAPMVTKEPAVARVIAKSVLNVGAAAAGVPLSISTVAASAAVNAARRRGPVRVEEPSAVFHDEDGEGDSLTARCRLMVMASSLASGQDAMNNYLSEFE